MGLDLYAGSLTRYYARDWETVVQRTGRELGVEVEIIQPQPAEDIVNDPDQILPIIMRWRSWISEQLQSEGVEPLDWDEHPDTPYRTDRPNWNGYGSLTVWAAREEHPRWFAQKTMGEDWAKDRSYRRSLKKGEKSRYSQLITGPEIWLPADFPGVIDATGPTGTDMRLGSLPQLRSQLDLLNQRTWRASPETILTWHERGPIENGTIEEAARYGYAVFDSLTRYAIEHGLPLKLDY